MRIESRGGEDGRLMSWANTIMTIAHYQEAQLKPQILSMLSTPRRLAKNSKQTTIKCSPGILLPVLTLFRGSV